MVNLVATTASMLLLAQAKTPRDLSEDPSRNSSSARHSLKAFGNRQAQDLPEHLSVLWDARD